VTEASNLMTKRLMGGNPSYFLIFVILQVFIFSKKKKRKRWTNKWKKKKLCPQLSFSI